MTAYSQPYDWFAAIASHTQVAPDRKGEVWLACPQCGARGKKFSVSEHGAHCFKCGYNPPLKVLAEQLGVRDGRIYEPPAVTPAHERKAAAWLPNARQLAWEFTQTPGLVQAWQAYKPVSAATVDRWRLGYGEWPGGLWDEKRHERCHHRRLIVPLFGGRGDVVGFRCRAVECDHARWLSPACSEMVLYGIDSVPLGADVLIVCENPIDALLVRQEWEGPAVATLGTSIWKDGYTDQVRAVHPLQVVIFFDNDVPGQAIDRAIIADWKARRRERGLPDDETKFGAGIKLANKLLAAGLPATFYRWPAGTPEGQDIGGLFK